MSLAERTPTPNLETYPEAWDLLEQPPICLEDPVNMAAEKPLKNRRLGKVVLASTMALSAITAVQNVDEYHRWHDIMSHGSMIPDVPGCPAYVPASIDTPPLTKPLPLRDLEKIMAPVKSGGNDRTSVWNTRPLRTWSQSEEFLRHPQISFVSRYSKLRLEIYSDHDDPNWKPNLPAIDSALHATLLSTVDFGNPEVNHVMDCLQDRIIVKQEFAGQSYPIYIPSNLDDCLVDGYVTRPNSPSDCMAADFTPPLFQLKFLFWKPMHRRFTVVTGGRYAEGEKGQKMAQLLRHVGVHAAQTITNTPCRLDPDERFVEYVTKKVTADFAAPQSIFLNMP